MTHSKDINVLVTSIGVAANGGVVIRVSINGGAQIQIATDVVSFAKLAAEGVQVINANVLPGKRRI